LITTLDTISWAPELVTGNAEFVESPSSPTGKFYVVSNVRNFPNTGFGVNFGGNFGLPLDNNFTVLESTDVPPAPGPGSSFITRATYSFPQPNTDFDPVVAIDASALPHPLLHIIGTRNTPTGTFTSSNQLNDLIKFTYDTVTHVLTGPTVLSTGARVRGSYDIAVLQNHNTIVAASLAEPTLSAAAITNVAVNGNVAFVTATAVASNVLTVTAVNNFTPGISVLLNGLTANTYLNGQTVVVTSATSSQFTATFFHANYVTTADTGTAAPAAVLTITANNNFVPGQWLLLNGLTNATFLNQQLIQVLTATPILFTALFLFPGVYPFTPDTGQAQQVGDSLLEMELDTNDVLVPGSPLIIASSPARTGDAYDAVSLITADSNVSGFGYNFGFDFGNAAGSEVELYYESHPKNFTFKDQVFTINLVNRQSAAAIITSSLEVGDILTITAANNFKPGMVVTLLGTQESFLNGLSVVVLTASSTQFTAAYVAPISEVNQHLLSAANFSLLGALGLLNYSAGSTVAGGNVGTFPGSDGFGINFNQNFGAGLPVLTPPAVAHINDSVAQQALIDATTAYGFFQSQPIGTIESVLDGLSLGPGTYTGSVMVLHDGQTLTLNGAGTYIFQVTTGGFGFQFGFGFNSSLTLGTGATINLTGGATADNIIWLVDGNAAFGAGSTMQGTVIALNNVTMSGGALHGRAIALLGTVTINAAETVTTQSTIPQPPYNNPADTGTATPDVPTWDSTPTVLTTFTGRYADNRLTVIADTSGNRYLSQTYWTQLNHPEGIIGNVMLGYKPANGAWGFHPTFGSTLGGSIIQSTLSVDTNLDVSLSYLLQPFDALPAPPTAVAWPFHVASVAIPSLGLTEVPGFYNASNFTWLRGTKSLVDNQSRWTIIGEREVATRVSETWTLPLTTTPSILPAHAATYEDNVSVVYAASNIPLVQVFTENPAQGQYYVEDSSGLYVFSMFDGGQIVSITYNYVSGVVPVFASLFNVPPIAELTPKSIILWRDTTFYSTDFTTVTSFSITSNVVTVIAANDFTPGQQVAIFGFQEAANEFLNGNTLTVLTASATQFTATFQHPDFTFIPGFGFGIEFGFGFGGVDFGFAAVLIAGPLTLDASGSFSPNSDPLTFIWTDNFSNQALVTITPSASGSTAVITVSPLVGGAPEQFNVGVAVEDLTAIPPHTALIPTSFSISGNVVTFTVPNNLIALEQVMPYNINLGAPSAPIVTVGPGNFGNYFGTYFIQITYVNAFGETTASPETVYGGFGNGPLVQSPPPSGDATGYNVYVGTASGNEKLQLNSAGVLIPTPIGTNWTMFGGILMGANPPTVSTATEMFLNDLDLTLTSSSPTQFTATPPAGVMLPTIPTTQIVGFVVPEFQFQIANIIVPQNTAPTITLPSPFWEPIDLPTEPYVSIDVARNSKITITPNYPIGAPWSNTVVYELGNEVTLVVGGSTFTYTSIQNNNVGNNPSTSPSFWAIVVFPVFYTGVTDPDDTPTYAWAQTSGTPVTIIGGTSSQSFAFDTNGVNINGETLTFTLTVNDGINPAVSTTFAVNVAAFAFSATARDTLQLSRSIYSISASVTNVVISNGIGVFTTSPNSFAGGQTVFFQGMTNATFLNGASFTVAPTGFGQSFGVGFGGNPIFTQFSIADSSLPNFIGSDTGTAYATLPISQRNAQLGWSPLDVSVMFTDFQAIKRTSVLDGSDRYIVISPYSVMVYGVFPDTVPASVLLRRLFLPNGALILDAVHTEQDYTLVLDNEGNIWRYTTAPFINTDNPDTKISLLNFTSLSFADADLANDVHILTTVNFGNQRVLVVSGEQGALLLQVNTTTLAVTGTFELTIASNFVYGADKVQFVRWVNMDSLHSGRILLGTILNNQAPITNIQIASNALFVTCANTFVVGDMITFSGITNATFLNGMTVKVIAATSSTFEVSIEHANYASTPDTGLAQSQFSGNTYETLIDLTQQQIIGTFDKSKLRNQFVETGEIMFDPDDPYAGGPTPPQMLLPVQATLGGSPFVKLSWLELRPDLMTSYTVQSATESTLSATVPASAPFTFLVPATSEFTADEGVVDTVLGIPLTRTDSPVPFPGQYNVTSAGLYTFHAAQAGDGLVITIRGAFNNLEIVNNGAVQTIYVSLPPGQTYFFQVQATGVDGTSGFSNVQQITI
jgi:hypothetical protein